MLYFLLVVTGAVPRPERDERGATAVEYALLATFAVLAIYGSVVAMRNALGSFYGSMQGSANTWR